MTQYQSFIDYYHMRWMLTNALNRYVKDDSEKQKVLDAMKRIPARFTNVRLIDAIALEFDMCAGCKYRTSSQDCKDKCYFVRKLRGAQTIPGRFMK